MLRILIVDDVEQNAIMLRVLLENYNHRVTFASNGKDALEILKDKEFDLIISDILMPYIDGFEFCKLVKANESTQNIPFIFYTATYMDQESKKYGLSLGADRYLLKPLEPHYLLATIDDLFADYKSRSLMDSRESLSNPTEMDLQQINLLDRLENGLFELEKKNRILKKLNSLTLELIGAKSVQEYFDYLLGTVQKYFPFNRVLVTALRDNQFITMLNKNMPMTTKIILLKYIAGSHDLMKFEKYVLVRNCLRHNIEDIPLSITGSCCFLPYDNTKESGIITLISDNEYNYEYAEYFFDNLQSIINKTIVLINKD
jgi:CheY-like chemotaxis protein